MGISNVFTIEDLTSYSGPLDDSAKEAATVSFPSSARLDNEVYDVLDYQLISTRDSGYQKYLIHWKVCSCTNAEIQ